MKTKNYIALLVVVSLWISAYSQQEVIKKDAKNIDFKEKLKTSIKKIGDINFTDIDSLYTDIDSLKYELQRLNDTIRKKDSIITCEKSCLDSLKQIVVLNSSSEIEYLRNMIKKQRDSIEKLERSIAYVDTVMVRLANDKLYGKFEKEKIDKTIKDFDRIYSVMLKKDFSQVKELLRVYETSYVEFIKILHEAQNDETKDVKFATEEYIDRYKTKIKEMYYYRRYYNNAWSIIYLNNKIDEAIKRLENHSSKTADFTDLLSE